MSILKRVVLATLILCVTAGVVGCPSLSQVGGISVGSDPDQTGGLITWPAQQVDPTGEDSAGFNHVISADMDGDGLLDLVTAAYESQPVQLHLQQRSPEGEISFRSFSIAGSGPIVRVSALAVADMDMDGNLDVIMSILDNGFAVSDDCADQQGSIVILFAPADPADNLNWEEFNLTRNYRCVLVEEVPMSFATLGFDGNSLCYASMDVGDVNDDGFPDILAAFNGCDQNEIPTKQVEIWLNPADDTIRREAVLVGSNLEQGGCVAEVNFSWQQRILQLDLVDISSVRFSDVDLDGDLDVVALRPEAKTFDLTWQANPLVPDGVVAVDGWNGAALQPIGESDSGLNFVEIGDFDGDGFNDVLALGREDRLLRWFRRPRDPAAQDFPWEVYNMVQYETLMPSAVDVADLDGNGQIDVVAAAGGRIRWFTPLDESPFESWSEQFVADDPEIGDGDATVQTAPFFPIHSVHAADIDGDGRMDIAATLDRDGVNDDAVVWFRNTTLGQE